MQEIYLHAFKSAVQQGKVCAVMTSYNLINGIHASQNDYLINKVLKSEWHFDGTVMSDWNSTYDAIDTANAGLDLEMPAGKYMNRENLIPAIKSGKVSVAVIDDKVRRILRTLIRMGFFDRPQKDETIPLNDPESNETALELARQGIVLLKNKNEILLLNSNKITSIMVLGPNADMKNNAYGGGGSSHIKPFEVVNVIEALKKLANGKFAKSRLLKKLFTKMILNLMELKLSEESLIVKFISLKRYMRTLLKMILLSD